MSERSQDIIRNEWINRPAHLMHLSLTEYKSAEEPKAATGTNLVISPEAPVTAMRARHEPGKMNGLEKRYAAHLELRRQTGEIRDWKFEPLKLKLAPATFYAPDFGVQMLDGSVELHETKGHWEDDARVKVKVAAAMFPWFRFVGARWDKSVKDWKFEEFTA